MLERRRRTRSSAEGNILPYYPSSALGLAWCLEIVRQLRRAQHAVAAHYRVFPDTPIVAPLLTGVSFVRPRHAMGAQRLPESVSSILHSIAIRIRHFLSLIKYVSRECMTVYDTCFKAHQALTLFGASTPPGQRRSKSPLICLAESFGVRIKLLARSTCVTPKRGP